MYYKYTAQEDVGASIKRRPAIRLHPVHTVFSGLWLKIGQSGSVPTIEALVADATDTRKRGMAFGFPAVSAGLLISFSQPVRRALGVPSHAE